MTHSFDVDIAVTYGLNEAILLNNIAFWVKQNNLNNHNCFEGKYWTYNSIKAYTGLFPYMSRETIKRALKHLKDEGIIETGNFNEDRFSHTNYYTLTEKGYDIVSIRANRLAQNEPFEKVKMSHSILNKNTDIADINNTDINIPPISPRENLFEMFWAAYPQNIRKANKKGCKAKFIKIENLESIFPEIMNSLELQKRSKDWNKQDGQFIPAPLTWINQERWTIQDTRTELEQRIDEATSEHFNDFLL